MARRDFAGVRAAVTGADPGPLRDGRPHRRRRGRPRVLKRALRRTRN